MIYNDPMLRRSKPPTPPEPVKPVKPDKPYYVTDDAFISQFIDDMFNNYDAWLVEPNPIKQPFSIEDMTPETGAVLPSDVYAPWVNYDDNYGDITLELKHSIDKFIDLDIYTYYPFVIPIGPAVPEDNMYQAYLHNLFNAAFLGTETVFTLMSTVIGFDPSCPYYTDGWAIMTLVDDNGSIQHWVLCETAIKEDVIAITLTQEVLREAKRLGCGALSGGLYGYAE